VQKSSVEAVQEFADQLSGQGNHLLSVAASYSHECPTSLNARLGQTRVLGKGVLISVDELKPVGARIGGARCDHPGQHQWKWNGEILDTGSIL